MRKLLFVLCPLSILAPAAAELEAASDEAVQRNNLGASLLQQAKVGEAIAEFQKAVALDPKYTAAYLNLGYAYDRQDRIEEATAQYQKVVALEPDNLLAHNNLGVLYDKKGLYPEATREFERARKEVEARPDDPRAAYNLGRLHASFSEKEQALKWLAKALELGFDDVKFLKDDPALAPLKDDPRFTGL